MFLFIVDVFVPVSAFVDKRINYFELSRLALEFIFMDFVKKCCKF